VTNIYDHRGLRGLVFTIEDRALRPGANLYLVTTPTGQAIAGNVGSLMPGVMASSGWSETAYRRLGEQDTAAPRAPGTRHPAQRRLSAPDRARPRGTATAVWYRCASSAMVAARCGNLGHWRRHLCRAASAAADRRHDRHRPTHYGRRSKRAAAGWA